MNEDVITTIRMLLLEIGIPTNLLGFNYVVHATYHALGNPQEGYRASKQLYITVAQQFNTTHICVERAIRNAIAVGMGHGNPELVSQIFKNSINPKKGVPNNSQFITSVCLYMVREQPQLLQ